MTELFENDTPKMSLCNYKVCESFWCHNKKGTPVTFVQICKYQYVCSILNSNPLLGDSGA